MGKARKEGIKKEKVEQGGLSKKINLLERNLKGLELKGEKSSKMSDWEDNHRGMHEIYTSLASLYRKRGGWGDKIKANSYKAKAKNYEWPGTLLKQFSPVLAIASFVIALLFISFNLTGYSIGKLTQENFRFAGTILFILGLVFVFFYFKNKR